MNHNRDHSTSDDTSSNQAVDARRTSWWRLGDILDLWEQRDPISLAWFSIFVSTMSWSWIPVFFVKGDMDESPVMFVTVLTFFMGTGALLAVGRTLWKECAELTSTIRTFRKLVPWIRTFITEKKGTKLTQRARRLRRLMVLVVLGSVGGLEFLLFAWALDHVSPPVAFMLFEMWPVWMTVAVASCPFLWTLRREGGRQWALWMGFAFCIVGIGVFSASHASVLDLLGADWYTLFTRTALLGIAIAVVAGLFAAGTVVCTRKAAEELSKLLRDREIHRKTIFFDSVVFGSVRMLLAPFLLVLALMRGEYLISWDSAGWAALGAGAMVVGALAFRMANRLAPNYSINVMYYLMPVLALGWLFLLGIEKGKTPIHLETLLIGAATIVTGNLLAVFNVDRSIAFKGLIISFWAFAGWAHIYEAQQYRLYYESIVAVVTVFVLLLSFRTDRLVRRIQQEEADTIWLWRAIAGRVKPGREKEARGHLYTLVTSVLTAKSRKTYQTFDLLEARKKAYGILQGPDLINAGEEGEEMRVKIDVLVNSKQQGANGGELMAIGILGAVAIGGLLFFLPEKGIRWSSGIGLFVELSAILLSSSIVFLFFYILDLQSDRGRPMVDPDAAGLKFPHADDRRKLEVIVAVVACLLILSSYSYVLWMDWEP